MKKPFLLYGFFVAVVAAGGLLQSYSVIYHFLGIYIILAVISSFLGSLHFILVGRKETSVPSLSLLLGSAWFALTTILLLIIGWNIGFNLTESILPSEPTLLTGVQFSIHFYIPFMVIWLLLFGLISASFISKKPFWLIESKNKYSLFLGILMLFYMFAGTIFYVRTIKQANFWKQNMGISSNLFQNWNNLDVSSPLFLITTGKFS